MPASQSTYAETHDEGRPGQIAKISTYDGDTKIVAEADGIGFGLACQVNADNEAEVGLSENRWLGLSVLDPTRDPIEGDEYAEGAFGTFAYRGDVYVQVEHAVDVGDLASADAVTGALSADGATIVWAAADDKIVGDTVSETSGGETSYSRCIRAHTTAAGNVADGAPSQANATAWEDTGAEQILLPEARFQSVAEEDGMGILRLSGIQFKTGAV